MKDHNRRQAQLDAERFQLSEASRRLRSGPPIRSNGDLAVSTLAIEASVARHRLDEHHAEFVGEFKSAAGGVPLSPNIQALQQQLTDAQLRIDTLQSDNGRLERQVAAQAALLAELTHEHHAENIVSLPRRRKAMPSPEVDSDLFSAGHGPLTAVLDIGVGVGGPHRVDRLVNLAGKAQSLV